MPMPPYPPAQVTRFATFISSKGGLQVDGVPTGNVMWINADGDYASPDIFNLGPASVLYKSYMYLNGSGTPSDGEDEADDPDIVSAAWSWQARIYSNVDPVGPYFLPTPPDVHVQTTVFSDSALAVHDPGDPANFYRPQLIGSSVSIPDFAPLDWRGLIGLGAAGEGDSMTFSCANPPGWGDSCALAYQTLQIVGSATWLAWWWRLPEKDSCGNRQPKAPMIYRREDPSEETGYQWEKLDPDDPTAHPTPVILSIEPNHGRVQGGEPIIIRGSGFGTEAAVTFDGVSALSVDVIDETEIRVFDPAHASGYVSVVVTNFDGVSS